MKAKLLGSGSGNKARPSSSVTTATITVIASIDKPQSARWKPEDAQPATPEEDLPDSPISDTWGVEWDGQKGSGAAVKTNIPWDYVNASVAAAGGGVAANTDLSKYEDWTDRRHTKEWKDKQKEDRACRERFQKKMKLEHDERDSDEYAEFNNILDREARRHGLRPPEFSDAEWGFGEHTPSLPEYEDEDSFDTADPENWPDTDSSKPADLSDMSQAEQDSKGKGSAKDRSSSSKNRKSKKSRDVAKKRKREEGTDYIPEREDPAKGPGGWKGKGAKDIWKGKDAKDKNFKDVLDRWNGKGPDGKAAPWPGQAALMAENAAKAKAKGEKKGKSKDVPKGGTQKGKGKTKGKGKDKQGKKGDKRDPDTNQGVQRQRSMLLRALTAGLDPGAASAALAIIASLPPGVDTFEITVQVQSTYVSGTFDLLAALASIFITVGLMLAAHWFLRRLRGPPIEDPVVAFPWPETQPAASQWPSDFVEDRPFPDTVDNVIHSEPGFDGFPIPPNWETAALDEVARRAAVPTPDINYIPNWDTATLEEIARRVAVPTPETPVRFVADGVDYTYYEHVDGRFIDTRTGLGGAPSPRGSYTTLPDISVHPHQAGSFGVPTNVASASAAAPTTNNTVSFPQEILVSAAIAYDSRSYHVSRSCRNLPKSHNLKTAALCKVCLAEVGIEEVPMLTRQL
jgi:hypothetical protein